MKFIFSTGSLYTYGLDRCFALSAQAGFDGVELMIDQRWDTRQVDYLKQLVERYRQPVLAVHSPFTPYVPGWPDYEPDRILASLRLAEDLGAMVVVHHLPFRRGWKWLRLGATRLPLPMPGQGAHGSYRRWLLEAYPDVQATTAVTLCIENMPARRSLGRTWTAHQWNTMEEIARFPALTMDTTHLGTWGLEPVEVYSRLQARVRHVHLSNFNGREHRRPEDGHLRLDELLATMAADGYRGLICLELNPASLNAGCPDEEMASTLSASLAVCRSWVNTR